MLSGELKDHLCGRLIPFWKRLRDTQYGGYYGWMDSNLAVDRQAVKGCILNSRILWFFSNAQMCLRRCGEKEECAGQREAAESLKEYADWAYRFLKENCVDAGRGGVYWSLDYQGRPEDTTKHTYNQAFAVYALSSYYRAYHEKEALELAESLVEVIETKCFDEYGYREALDIDFCPVANDKLSENGVLADRTMNTLLHVLEAYTEYLLACRERRRTEGEGNGAKEDPGPYRGEEGKQARDAQARKSQAAAGTGCGNGKGCARREWEQVVTRKLRWILNLVEEKVYNPALHRQEVFFDRNMESLIDLHSYGHDIEAAWLIDRCLEVLGDDGLTEKMSPILRSLENQVYEKAYSNHSLANECERGVVDEKRVWWVQAEGIVGFNNAWRKTGETRFREAAEDIWQFVKAHLVDRRTEGEWFWYTDASGNPALEKPVVEPWKCPYHNGRMCMELINGDMELEI